MNDDVLGM